MVKPQEEREIALRMLEDRLADKFDLLQMAREQRNHIVFDEIGRSIEVLLRAIPQAYNSLMEQKEVLDGSLNEQLAEIEERAENAPNKIAADSIRSNEAFQAQWDYREVYEEILIDLMQTFKLVPVRYGVLGEMIAPEEEEIEAEIPPPKSVPKLKQNPPPQPVKQEKKPKLSIPKQQEGFEV